MSRTNQTNKQTYKQKSNPAVHLVDLSRTVSSLDKTMIMDTNLGYEGKWTLRFLTKS